jgi:hypothetical protein
MGGLFEAHDRSGAGHDWTAAHAAHWPRHVVPRSRQQWFKCIILESFHLCGDASGTNTYFYMSDVRLHIEERLKIASKYDVTSK